MNKSNGIEKLREARLVYSKEIESFRKSVENYEKSLDNMIASLKYIHGIYEKIGENVNERNTA